MSERAELVRFAEAEAASVAALCRRFAVSRKTAYKWIRRYRAEGPDGLHDRSRRPAHTPEQTAKDMERAVVAMRQEHSAWGCRKIQKRLRNIGLTAVPAASTVHAVLQRYGLVEPAEASKHRAFRRFEYPRPNDLWQMDFKGHFAMRTGQRCHPLTVLDDHSRYCLALRACGNEQSATVREHLRMLFLRYGLPQALLMDNGPPWGTSGEEGYTDLEVWFIRLEIRVAHGRARHPQTQGKEERFHRTLKAELLCGRQFEDLTQTQHDFDRWRDVYNQERPHESLAMGVPAERYQPSPREYPKELPTIEYGPSDIVRKVQARGEISFRGQTFRVGNPLHGYQVALRPTSIDGVLDVYFCHQRIRQIDLRDTSHQAPAATEKG